jgi:hypothetical protein
MVRGVMTSQETWQEQAVDRAWRQRVPPSSLLSGNSCWSPAPVAPQVPDLLQWDRRVDLPVKNTFIEFPNTCTPPTGAARIINSCPPGTLDKENAGNLPAAPKQPFTPLKGEAEEDLLEGSAGSGMHPHSCKPCAWFHHARGCQRGDSCEFCHLCPPGEIKRRKKDKYRQLRERRGVA